MTAIKRAIVKSYDAASHRATVQIEGSLAVWLEDIAVASDIPAQEVVAGRQCSVLLFEPDNPQSGVVISVQGAVPASPSTSRIEDADGDTYVDSEQAANEDKVRIAAGGTERGLFQTVSPHITLSGDLQVSGFTRLATYGNVIGDAVSEADTMLKLRPVDTGESVSSGRVGISVQPQWTATADNLTFVGISGNAMVVGGSTGGHWIYGLNFQSIVAGGSYALLIGARARVGGHPMMTMIASSLVTSLAAAPMPPATGSAITDVTGLLVENHGLTTATNVYGIKVDDITAGSNRYLAWLGGSTPNLRLDAGSPQDAALKGEGDSNLFLAWMENGALNLRRLRWKSYSTLQASDRVLVAA